MRNYFEKAIVIISVLLLSLSIDAQVFSINNKYRALPDGNVEIMFTFELKPNWYIYGANHIENGPMPTTFEVEQGSGYELVGTLENGATPRTKIDQGFGVEVEYFEEKAFFKQIVKPFSKEPFTISGELIYQTCNGNECTLNEESVNINIDPSKITVSGKDGVPDVAQTAESEKSVDNSPLWSFLLIAFLAGLSGVITPCVFPMIPMTVGFLIGGGSSKKAGILKGVIFGLSIILIYTALGLIVALFKSTAATDAIGTHWIPNLIFALLFLIFAVSFLGAFEITLPSGLANKADKKADKGGYIAAFFVAVAMVIVSFACTGPFVGSILAISVMHGVALRPILGMIVFGFAFSLPFVLLSFFPSVMKKLPKSGGWLNVVKIVFAFIMLAFAMKFIYNIDAYFGWGIITRLGYLSIWAALSLLLGLYFLGIFRTNHDSPVNGIGWGRSLAAIVTISFTFYLIAGIFGAPLKSISGLIPPQDGSTIMITSSAISEDNTAVDNSGYASLKSFPNIDDALAESKNAGKPVFIAFKSHTCSVCKVMEATVLSDSEILNKLRDEFIIANLYVDDKTPDEEYKTLGKRIRDYEMKTFGSASQPLYAIVASDGSVIAGPIGNSDKEEFLKFLSTGR